MSILPNRSFSVQMENTNVSNYDAFKELTTNRNWNRGSIKIDYNEDRAVTALRCANHSINPFSRSEKFSEQDVKNTNDTFELAIRGEIRKLGDLAIQKAAQKAGVEIKDKKNSTFNANSSTTTSRRSRTSSTSWWSRRSRQLRRSGRKKRSCSRFRARTWRR